MRTTLSKELLDRCPAYVAFSIVEPHETQAWRNHSQTLTRLSERGGLDPAELVAVLEDRPILGPRAIHLSDVEAVDRLLELLEKIELAEREGELHFHGCPACYAKKPCRMDCTVIDWNDDGRPMGGFTICDDCRAAGVFQGSLI